MKSKHTDLFFPDYFTARARFHEKVEKAKGRLQALELWYEDLADDYNGEMKRIQEFLGVDYEAVQPATYKQSRLPLAVAISNYAELKERFNGTPWEMFFEA